MTAANWRTQPNGFIQSLLFNARLDSDPVLPDCRPGENVSARGMIWFYKGRHIRAVFKKP